MMKEDSVADEEKKNGEEKSVEEAVEEVEEDTEPLAKEEEFKEAEEEKVEAEEELPSVEEEIEPLPQEEVEEEIVEERLYTIPLGKAWIAPAQKRVPKAIRIIRDFVNRHMKLVVEEELEEEEEPKKLIISNEVNERVWRRGIQKPPRKVRVRAARDVKGNVTVYLAE
jgi:large subunit ribosomal protein L31e